MALTCVVMCYGVQGAAWMDPKQDAERLDMLGRWMAAFPWAMKCHLRADEDPEYELKVCCGGAHVCIVLEHVYCT